jgi:hypothetical protein
MRHAFCISNSSDAVTSPAQSRSVQYGNDVVLSHHQQFVLVNDDFATRVIGKQDPIAFRNLGLGAAAIRQQSAITDR